YLLANMGDLREQTTLLEFTIQQPTLEILDAILGHEPTIVGLGIYIWNVEETTRLVADLKRLRPDIVVVLGGPEVSYEADEQPIVRLADHVISGEADIEFARLCRAILTPHSNDASYEVAHKLPVVSQPRSLAAPLPTLIELTLPYDAYSADDIANRVIYVEAS